MSKLSSEARLALLQENLRRKSLTWVDVDTEHARQITFVERELGFPIMSDYPLAKFIQQYEDIIYFKQEENKQTSP